MATFALQRFVCKTVLHFPILLSGLHHQQEFTVYRRRTLNVCPFLLQSILTHADSKDINFESEFLLAGSKLSDGETFIFRQLAAQL